MRPKNNDLPLLEGEQQNRKMTAKDRDTLREALELSRDALVYEQSQYDADDAPSVVYEKELVKIHDALALLSEEPEGKAQEPVAWMHMDNFHWVISGPDKIARGDDEIARKFNIPLFLSAQPSDKRVAGISEDPGKFVEEVVREWHRKCGNENCTHIEVYAVPANWYALHQIAIRYFATHYGGQPSGNPGELGVPLEDEGVVLSNEDIDTIAKFVEGPTRNAERWDAAHSALILYRDHINIGTPLPPTPSAT